MTVPPPYPIIYVLVLSTPYRVKNTSRHSLHKGILRTPRHNKLCSCIPYNHHSPIVLSIALSWPLHSLVLSTPRHLPLSLRISLSHPWFSLSFWLFLTHYFNCTWGWMINYQYRTASGPGGCRPFHGKLKLSLRIITWPGADWSLASFLYCLYGVICPLYSRIF